MSRYVWYKNGKEKMMSHDFEGEKPSRVIISDNEWICYHYVLFTLSSVVYYKNGEQHRSCDKPAEYYYNIDGLIESEYYCKNGEIHRDDDSNGNPQPAVINYNPDGSIGRTSYYKNGKLKLPNTMIKV